MNFIDPQEEISEKRKSIQDLAHDFGVEKGKKKL